MSTPQWNELSATDRRNHFAPEIPVTTNGHGEFILYPGSVPSHSIVLTDEGIAGSFGYHTVGYWFPIYLLIRGSLDFVTSLIDFNTIAFLFGELFSFLANLSRIYR